MIIYGYICHLCPYHLSDHDDSAFLLEVLSGNFIARKVSPTMCTAIVGISTSKSSINRVAGVTRMMEKKCKMFGHFLAIDGNFWSKMALS